MKKMKKTKFLTLILIFVLISSAFYTLFSANYLVHASTQTPTLVHGPYRTASTSTSFTVTTTSTPTSGDVLIAVIGTSRTSSGSVRTISSISETNVAWSMQKSESYATATPEVDVEIWLGVVSASAGTTVTINLSGSPSGAVADICEYSGIATTSYLDQTAVNTGSSAATDTGLTGATTQATELWIGGITVGAANAQTVATSGFTLRDGATGTSISVAYLENFVSATGTANSGTTVSSSRWVGCIATFKAAGPAVVLSPTSGNIGSSVTVTAAGMLASQSVTATLGSTSVTLSSSTTDGSGGLSATFTVPAITSGSKTFTLTDGTNSPTATFSVAAPTLTRNPTSGGIGTVVTVSGSNYIPSASVVVNFGSTTMLTLTATSSGALPSTGNTFAVPTTTSGSQTISASDGINTATASFTVNAPTLTLIPTSGPLNTVVTVSGANYVPSGTVTIKFDSTIVLTITATSSGALPITGNTFVVPTSTVGSHSVTAIDGTNSATATFTVNAASVSLNPTSGRIGTTVTVTGSNFIPSSSVTVRFGSVTVLTVTATAAGAIPSSGNTFAVPTAASGSNTVTANDGTNSPTATFTVTAPTLTLNPTSGQIGTVVTVSGSNYVPSGSVVVKFGLTTVLTLTASSSGALPSSGNTFVVPTITSGSQTVSATDGTNTATASFSVTAPTLTLNPTSGPPGTVVTVSGANYVPSGTVTIKFDSTTELTLTATGTGSLPSGGNSFVMPTATSGSHIVTASDGTNSATATSTVTIPTLTLSPASGIVGMSVTVSGSNYVPSSAITIKYNGATVASTTATSSGAIPTGVTFAVPASPLGVNTVTATDSYQNSASATFTVATFAIDGSVSATGGTTSPMTTTLTTTNTGDLLYISVLYANDRVASAPTSTGLTWIQRSSTSFPGPSPTTMTLVTYYATGAPKGSIPISFTISGATSSREIEVAAFAIAGQYNINSPFDGTFKSNTGSSTSASVSGGFSTNVANDFVIGTVGVNGVPTLTQASGFTQIANAGTVRLTSNEYEIVGTPQTVAVGYTLSASQNWGMVADAVQQAQISYSTSTTLNAISTPLTAGQTGISFSGLVSSGTAVPDGKPVVLQYSTS